MSINQTHMEAWWTSPRAQPQPQALYTSPLWGTQSVKSFATVSNKSYSTAPTSIDSAAAADGNSARALQLRYNDIARQLQQCRTLEAQLLEQQEKIVLSMFISNKDSGFASNPTISPPEPEDSPEDRDPPPTRQQMITRLIEGQRENYRRIFVPGRGWVSKSNLQSELCITEGELDRMARL